VVFGGVEDAQQDSIAIGPLAGNMTGHSACIAGTVKLGILPLVTVCQ
jgi:hypothetical protein